MTQVDRLIFATRLVFSFSVLALIMVRVVGPIADRLPESASFRAPVDLMQTLIPVIIAGMFLFAGLYVIAGPFQRERAASREVRRRR